MTRVLLATCAHMPDGEEWAGTNLLVPALVKRGLEPEWVVWDDPSVDWSAGLVCVRSTWDYAELLDEFLAWARTLPRMLNSASIFEWNTDKAYLPRLASLGVPTVPTISVEAAGDLAPAIENFGVAVVKPRVGAGGRGVVIAPASSYGEGPWVVQPLVESVRTQGETSVFVLDGKVISQTQKRPAAGEIRVHEQYGGSNEAVGVTDEAATLALAAVAAAESLLSEALDYARVDAMRLADGRLAVSELEVTEPGLYLEVLPQNAAAFAELVALRLGGFPG